LVPPNDVAAVVAAAVGVAAAPASAAVASVGVVTAPASAAAAFVDAVAAAVAVAACVSSSVAGHRDPVRTAIHLRGLAYNAGS